MDVFIQRCEEPWKRCFNDCFSAPADQLHATFGVDPMARFRGRYTSVLGFKRVLRKAGYRDEVEAFEAEMKAHGWQNCAAPFQDYDTRIVKFVDGAALVSAPALYFGGMWNIRSEAGHLGLEIDGLTDGGLRYGG